MLTDFKIQVCKRVCEICCTMINHSWIIATVLRVIWLKVIIFIWLTRNQSTIFYFLNHPDKIKFNLNIPIYYPWDGVNGLKHDYTAECLYSTIYYTDIIYCVQFYVISMFSRYIRRTAEVYATSDGKRLTKF